MIDPAWIEQALVSTGTVSIRRRRLPAERIVWLVVGLALFKNEPIWLIVQQLGLALGEAKVPVFVWLVVGLALFKNEPIWLIVQQLGLALGEAKVPVSSAAVQARQRLGEAPLAVLFEQLAQAWGGVEQPPSAGFLGLRSFAVDGVVW
ncbi:transposase domain-containing protein, partial [Pseudomonas sp. ICMP 8385]|uniref:transposase domain-containing protein n=1 Tax=Pseudomonas sp. ICMP 8385 TaxID=1718920 RepID=UPI00159B97D6